MSRKTCKNDCGKYEYEIPFYTMQEITNNRFKVINITIYSPNQNLVLPTSNSPCSSSEPVPVTETW